MDDSPSPDADPSDLQEPMTAIARLTAERAALAARLERLTQDMSALVAASRDSNADDEHDPEGQTIAYERSQLAAVTSQASSHLAQVEAALVRVTDGTYGVCEICHKQITAERLARSAHRTDLCPPCPRLEPTLDLPELAHTWSTARERGRVQVCSFR